MLLLYVSRLGCVELCIFHQMWEVWATISRYFSLDPSRLSNPLPRHSSDATSAPGSGPPFP